MGLKTAGENGCKAQLKTHCERAFRSYDTLLDARKGIGGTREQTAVVLDFNVVLMSAPESVSTLSEYVKICFNFVEHGMASGWLLALVFDEPERMTLAKRQEQARRDAAKKVIPCSEDIDPFPFSDDFSSSDLDQCECILKVRDKRKCRSRLYDEVAKRVYQMALEKAFKWNQSGNPAHRTVLLLDGVDLRGCDRPPFEPRRVRMECNDDAVGALFHRQTSVGEGDIKLQLIEDRIRALSGFDLKGTNLVMLSTIDTDSLMISSLAVSKRRAFPIDGSNSVHSVLCMRTPASRSDKASGAGASYLVIDVAMLEALILQHVYGRGAAVDPTTALDTMIAIASSAALSGSDFVSAPGTRFDHFFNSIHDFARTEPAALRTFRNALSSQASDARRTAGGLTRLCVCASVAMEEKGKRYAKQSKQVADVSDENALRAAWTVAYWLGNEHVADETFGF